MTAMKRIFAHRAAFQELKRMRFIKCIDRISDLF
jgi:hypothetical protein